MPRVRVTPFHPMAMYFSSEKNRTELAVSNSAPIPRFSPKSLSP